MKKTLLTQLKAFALPTLFVGTLLTLFNPAIADARDFGGRGYSGGRQSFAVRGGGGYARGPVYRGGGPAYRGGSYYRGPVYRGGYWGGRGYYGGSGLYLGFGAGPAYGYYGGGYCQPAGFYDQWGNWRYYRGCAVAPPPAVVYGYPYR